MLDRANGWAQEAARATATYVHPTTDPRMIALVRARSASSSRNRCARDTAADPAEDGGLIAHRNVSRANRPEVKIIGGGARGAASMHRGV